MRLRRRGDRGAGMVSTIAGLTAFIALLLFAVQLTVNLYATSAVTDTAYEAARTVAGAASSGNLDAAIARAEQRARTELGDLSERVEFTWTVDTDVVAVRVRAVNPRFLLPSLGRLAGFDAVDRTVVVRVESVR